MALITYTGNTDYIANLDDEPNDTGGLTPAQLKALFDRFGTEFVAWFNSTHIEELGGAWTAYTPTVAAASGTLTTVSASGRYKIIGKNVYFTIQINITTNGTGASAITASLPAAAVNKVFIVQGREDALSGKMLQGLISNSASVTVFDYNNGYPGGTGARLYVTGVYECV